MEFDTNLRLKSHWKMDDILQKSTEIDGNRTVKLISKNSPKIERNRTKMIKIDQNTTQLLTKFRLEPNLNFFWNFPEYSEIPLKPKFIEEIQTGIMVQIRTKWYFKNPGKKGHPCNVLLKWSIRVLSDDILDPRSERSSRNSISIQGCVRKLKGQNSTKLKWISCLFERSLQR